MQPKINNGKNSYLYCSVDCQVSNYADDYANGEECFADIRQEIIDDCTTSEYTEQETNKVLSYYESLFNNSCVTWRG